MGYSIPSVAKNKHLRQDILDLNINREKIKGNTFEKQVTDSIFENKNIRSVLKKLSKV